MSTVRLVKVQVAAEFVIDPGDGGPLEPGVYGPVELTAKDWAAFDLVGAVEAGVAGVLDKPPGV